MNSPPLVGGARGGGRSQEGLRKVLARVEKLKSLKQIDAMIEYVLQAFYETYAEATFENANDRIEDLEQLAIFARTYSAGGSSPGDSLEQFLADATLSEGFRGERGVTREGLSFVKDSPSEEYLVLSTIHQAKGLEWKNVFVLGLVDGQFPHYKSRANRAEMEEERRLFYVAITRAKERLFLTYPLTSMASMGTAINQPSLFVRELDPRLYKTMLEDEEEVIEIE